MKKDIQRGRLRVVAPKSSHRQTLKLRNQTTVRLVAIFLPYALFAWDLLLNHWQSPEISRSAVLRAFRKVADKEPRPPSDVTLEQHFDTFLHTYFPTRSRKGEILEC